MGHLEFQVTINFYGRWRRVNTVRDVVKECWLNLQYIEDVRGPLSRRSLLKLVDSPGS